MKVVNRVIGAGCIALGFGGAIYLLVNGNTAQRLNDSGLSFVVALVGAGLVGIGIWMCLTGRVDE